VGEVESGKSKGEAVMIKSAKMRETAEMLRKIRLNQPPITREDALKLFEQHRKAAAASRLALKIHTDAPKQSAEAAAGREGVCGSKA
jgi:hypothetical protein